MALLRIGHRPWWSGVPLIGRLAPVQREERNMATDPCLKMKVTSRPVGMWDWLKRFSLWNLVTSRLGGGAATAGDHLVVDTGTRLVDIKGDYLDLRGIRQGDSVEFRLDPGVDPGGATLVKGEVVLVQDAPDPVPGTPHGTCKATGSDKRLDRPIDPLDPVSDLVVRRAELFQAFREGKITQEMLTRLWDSLRNQALDAVKNGNWSYFEQQDLMARLIEMAAFTEEEAARLGARLDDYVTNLAPDAEPPAEVRT